MWRMYLPDASEHAALVEVVMKAHGDVLVKARGAGSSIDLWWIDELE